MATDKKSGTLVKSVIVIVLLAGVVAAAYFYFKPCNQKAEVEESIEVVESFETSDGEDIADEVVLTGRLTKAQLEESINSTEDGSVPEMIWSGFSKNVQKVVVKNDPNASIADFNEVWVLKYLGMYSKITVVEEECVYDSEDKLEKLVIIAE